MAEEEAETGGDSNNCHEEMEQKEQKRKPKWHTETVCLLIPNWRLDF